MRGREWTPAASGHPGAQGREEEGAGERMDLAHCGCHIILHCAREEAGASFSLDTAVPSSSPSTCSLSKEGRLGLPASQRNARGGAGRNHEATSCQGSTLIQGVTGKESETQGKRKLAK